MATGCIGSVIVVVVVVTFAVAVLFGMLSIKTDEIESADWCFEQINILQKH